MTKTKRQQKGFTLIELLIAIAIVSIIAAAIIVTTGSIKERARAAKALGLISSAIPNMVSCWGNGKDVNNPSDGGNICGSDSNYGKWPDTRNGDIASYDYGTGSGNVDVSGSASWFLFLESPSSNDNVRVCCNSAMKSCKIGISGSTCNASSPSN